MIHKHSDYMYWAKTKSRARYNLATSGVGAFPLRDLNVDCSRLEIIGDNSYGYAPLKNAIGAQYGVGPECIVTAEGASMANYLTMAALLNPGDEALIERPAYGLLVDAALQIGAKVNRLERAEENGYALDPSAVSRAITPQTKLIVVTNLHNPSGALTSESVLREIAAVAAGVNAMLLVIEIYLNAVYDDTPGTAFHLAPNIITTSSLTKIYGVSGLRCGWIFAQPDLAEAMRRLNDVFAATPVFPGEQLSVAAFAHLDKMRERARKVVEADRAALAEFLDSQPKLSAVRTRWGTTAFVRLHSGNPDAFFERLRSEYETSVAPGRFFEMPDHFRIGMGVNHEMFCEGLRRIGECLVQTY